MNSETLSFSLKRNEQSVEIDSEQYVLVELDGLQRDDYLNDVGGRMRIGPKGQPAGVKNFKGMQANLLSMSLKKLESGEQKPVKVQVIQTWPAKVVSQLFDAAKELSDLGQEGEVEVPGTFLEALEELDVDDKTIEAAKKLAAKKETDKDEEGND